jgi:hypothetical protein
LAGIFITSLFHLNGQDGVAARRGLEQRLYLISVRGAGHKWENEPEPRRCNGQEDYVHERCTILCMHTPGQCADGILLEPIFALSGFYINWISLCDHLYQIWLATTHEFGEKGPHYTVSIKQRRSARNGRWSGTWPSLEIFLVSTLCIGLCPR